jgi:hypothetical protein
MASINLWPGEGGGGGKSGDGEAHSDVQAGDDVTQVDHEVRVPAPHAHHLCHNGRLLILVFLPHLSVPVILNQKKRDEFCFGQGIADPDPNSNPSDPYVFGPPGSGSI